MKLVRLSNDKVYALIGEDATRANWYTIEPNVKKFVESIEPDTEVTFKSIKKNNKDFLTYITKVNGTVQHIPSDPVGSPDSLPPVPDASQQTKSFTKYTKSPAEQETIKRQAIGHMTSRTLIALQGQISPESAETFIRKYYTLYQELVG